MAIEKQLFVSPVPRDGYRQLFGSEAQDALVAMGLTHVHVDDDGVFHALSEDRRVLEGHRLYERQTVATMGATNVG